MRRWSGALHGLCLTGDFFTDPDRRALRDSPPHGEHPEQRRLAGARDHGEAGRDRQTRRRCGPLGAFDGGVADGEAAVGRQQARRCLAVGLDAAAQLEVTAELERARRLGRRSMRSNDAPARRSLPAPRCRRRAPTGSARRASAGRRRCRSRDRRCARVAQPSIRRRPRRSTGRPATSDAPAGAGGCASHR